MKYLNPLTAATRYIWMDGEYIIHFQVRECADQYQKYYGGFIIPV